MNHSESIIHLADALVKAQAQMQPAKMNAENKFLKNRYADLGAVIAVSRPVLSQFGLAVSQFPISAEGQIGVETILIHSSGEWLSERVLMPLGEEKGKSDAQVAGSAITYLRRYSLASVLGIHDEEDNDGNAQRRTVVAQPKPTPRVDTATGEILPPPPPPEDEPPSHTEPSEKNAPPPVSVGNIGAGVHVKSSPMSQVQRRKLVELYQNLHGCNEKDALLGLDQMFIEVFGNGGKLATYEEAATIIAKLLATQRAR